MAKELLAESFSKRLQQYSHRIAESWFACFEPVLKVESLVRLKRELTHLREDADTFSYGNIVRVVDEGVVAIDTVIGDPALPNGKELIYRKIAQVFLELDKRLPALGVASVLSSEQALEGLPLIFIVDDSPHHLISIAEQIELFSYRAITFFNLHDLFVALKQLLPDALILDVTLAEGISPDLLPELCMQFGFPHQQLPPTIFMSAHDLPVIRLKSAKAGGEAFLVKPIEASQLIEVLDRALPRRSAESTRVLVVDDQKSQILFYQKVFEATDFMLDVCSNVQLVLQKVVDFRPDVVLLDLYMPGYTGLDVARAIRQCTEHAGVQIVFVSAETNPEIQRKILMTVGEAFIQKPVDPDYLIEVVNSRAAYSRMVSELISRDSLTGLLNHAEIKRKLDIEYSRAHRLGCSLSAVMIDIDHFKQVNDVYGHVVGDKVIKTLSLLLNDSLRRIDVVGRYGGEEFLVILPDTDIDSAKLVIERILIKFAAITQFSEAVFHATFSAGIACLNGSETVEALLVAADSAMYQAKQGGRNQVVCRWQ